MSIAEIMLNIFNWILIMVGIIGIVGAFPFSVIGIIFLVKSSEGSDVDKKKFYKKRGIVLLILPWIFILSSLILVMIVSFIRGIFLGVNI